MTNWTQKMVSYLKRHGKTKSNIELAKYFGVSISTMCRKKYKMGVGKCKQVYWSDEETKVVAENYKNLGDYELAILLRKICPRKESITAKAIQKRRQWLKLNRTSLQVKVIRTRNALPGGPSHTLPKNSAGVNLPDLYIANLMAPGNNELKRELVKYPDLIELKRNNVKLKRAINGDDN